MAYFAFLSIYVWIFYTSVVSVGFLLVGTGRYTCAGWHFPELVVTGRYTSHWYYREIAVSTGRYAYVFFIGDTGWYIIGRCIGMYR